MSFSYKKGPALSPWEHVTSVISLILKWTWIQAKYQEKQSRRLDCLKAKWALSADFFSTESSWDTGYIRNLRGTLLNGRLGLHEFWPVYAKSTGTTKCPQAGPENVEEEDKTSKTTYGWREKTTGKMLTKISKSHNPQVPSATPLSTEHTYTRTGEVDSKNELLLIYFHINLPDANAEMP